MELDELKAIRRNVAWLQNLKHESRPTVDPYSGWEGDLLSVRGVTDETYTKILDKALQAIDRAVFIEEMHEWNKEEYKINLSPGQRKLYGLEE